MSASLIIDIHKSKANETKKNQTHHTETVCFCIHTQSIHSTSIFVVYTVDVVHTVSHWQVLTGEMANLE